MMGWLWIQIRFSVKKTTHNNGRHLSRVAVTVIFLLLSIGLMPLAAQVIEPERYDIGEYLNFSGYKWNYDGSADGHPVSGKVSFDRGTLSAFFGSVKEAWDYSLSDQGLFLQGEFYGDEFVNYFESYSSLMRLVPLLVEKGGVYTSSGQYNGSSDFQHLNWVGSVDATVKVLGLEKIDLGMGKMDCLHIEWTSRWSEQGAGFDTEEHLLLYEATGSQTTSWWLMPCIGIARANYLYAQTTTITPTNHLDGGLKPPGTTVENQNVHLQIRPDQVPLNLTRLVALEVNQAVQDWNNSVPLIKGKKTIVRAFLEPKNPGDKIIVEGAKLRAYSGGSELPKSGPNPFSGLSPLKKLQLKPDVARYRDQFDASLNFELPPEWTQQDDIELVLDWPGSCVQGLGPATNQRLAHDLTVPCHFIKVEPLKVKFVYISFQDDRGTYYSRDPDTPASELARRLKAIYPIDLVDARESDLDLSITYGIAVRTGNDGRFSDADTIQLMRDVNDLLESQYLADDEPDRYLFGVLPDAPYFQDSAGLAIEPTGFVACGLTQESTPLHDGWPSGVLRNLVAHELGHVLGLEHAITEHHTTHYNGDGEADLLIGRRGEPAPLDVSIFPFSDAEGDATIGPSQSTDNYQNPSQVLVYGLDTSRGTTLVMSPTKHFELMSYALPYHHWISTHTYKALLNVLAASTQPSSLRSADLPEAHIVVRGVPGDLPGSAQVTSVVLADKPVPNFVLNASYTLRLLDAGSTLLSEVGFEPRTRMVEFAPSSQSNSLNKDFLVSVPYSPLARRIEVWHTNQLLLSYTASAHAPKVHVLFPNGGQSFGDGTIPVQWEGSDEDGDELTYNVQYSRDGGLTWNALAVALSGTNLVVDFNQLGGTASGLIRVRVSDGFNQAEDVSDAVFSVGNHRPGIEILSPTAHARLFTELSASFTATARDVDDGPITGTNIVWSSSVDGILGTGESLSIDVASLSLGAHEITATATDRDGQSNSARVLVTVVPDSPPVPPVITGGPYSDSFLWEIGSYHSFGVFADGSPPLHFQWRFNGNDIPGATGRTLWIENVSATDEGGYSVVVSNEAGSDTSEPGDVIVYRPSAPAADFHWSLQSGGSGSSVATDVAVDLNGNVLVTGQFTGVRDFGGIILTNDAAPYGIDDVFIAKYTAGGQLVWVRSAGGPGMDSAWKIAVDSGGNSWITGSFGSEALFGNVTLTNRVAWLNFFLAKYDPQGNLLWAKQTGGAGVDFGNALCLDSQGNCQVAGGFARQSDWMGTSLSSSSDDLDVFIASFDPSGNLRWVRSAGGAGSDFATAMASDTTDGGIIVTGSTQLDASFATLSLTNVVPGASPSDSRLGFVAKYNQNGDAVWVKAVGGGNGGFPSGIAARNGHFFLTGSFGGIATFGNQQLTNQNGLGVFVARFNSAGNALWADQFGGTNSIGSAYGIISDGADGCIVTGTFDKIVRVNGAAQVSAGANDIFVLNVDGAGAFTQFARTGTKGNDVAFSLATSPSGVTYLVGGLDDAHLLIAAMDGAQSLPRPPAMALQPRDQLLNIGDSFELSTSSIGGAPLAYQWFQSGQPLTWATTATLYWWAESIEAGGDYKLVVTNSAGTVSSRTVTVTISDDLDHDLMSDAWEIANGLNPADPSDAVLDPDSDEINNRDEFRAGTDPRDPESFSRFQKISVDRGLVSLQFLAFSNKTYTVEWKSTLASANWTTLTNIGLRPDSRLETIIDPTLHTAFRVYRLVTPMRSP